MSFLQVRYYRVTGENLQFPNLKTSIVIISIGCLLLAVCFLLSLCALLDGFFLRHTTAYYHIITMINMNCALWYINCKAIKIASQSLSASFRRVMYSSKLNCICSPYSFLIYFFPTSILRLIYFVKNILTVFIRMLSQSVRRN